MSPRVEFEGESREALPDETVLETLERHGHALPSSCRVGTCRSCLLRAVDGSPGEGSQPGLRETLRAAGYFLACQARPAQDLRVELPGEALSVRARIAAVRPIGHRILEVSLRLSDGEHLDYRAGQFVSLLRPVGPDAVPLARSYSLASQPADGELRLHVRHYDEGVMSGWLAAQARPGDELQVRGPFGECYYLPGRPDQPLLLVGTGTGLAPLYGIVRDALEHGHTGAVHLVHGVATAAGLYFVDELAELARRFPQLHLYRCLLKGSPSEASDGGATPSLMSTHVGNLVEVAPLLFPEPAGHRVFLCGDPETVQGLRRVLFMNGASNREIHADEFVPPARPARPGGA